MKSAVCSFVLALFHNGRILDVPKGISAVWELMHPLSADFTSFPAAGNGEISSVDSFSPSGSLFFKKFAASFLLYATLRLSFVRLNRLKTSQRLLSGGIC